MISARDLTPADLERCARLMIRLYGAWATRRAQERALELWELGEPSAFETWMRIKAAIEQLQTEKPAPGETAQ